MFKIGTQVEFKPKVFDLPYAPYYDQYYGNTFEIVNFHVEHNDDLIGSDRYIPTCHVELKCISNPEIKVTGFIHDDEIYPV